MTKKALQLAALLIVSLAFLQISFAALLPWENRDTGDIFVEVYTNYNVFTIDWSDLAQRQTDYIIKVFDDGARASEPFFTEKISGSGGAFVKIDFDLRIKSIKIELAHANNTSDDGSLILSKTIPLNTGVRITSSDGEQTNTSQTLIEYDIPGSITASVFVNERSGALNLSGTGNFSLEIADGYNVVEIQYSMDDPNIIYITQFGITVKTTPPMLHLPEHRSAIYVDADEFILAGVTDRGASLSVAGFSVGLDSDGVFMHPIRLEDGENIIKVTAADSVGNITEQDVIITKVDNLAAADTNLGVSLFWKTIKEYLPLILSFLGSIILLLVAFLIGRGFRKSSAKGLYVFTTTRNIAIVLTIISAGASGYCLWKYLMLRKLSASEDYFALARESIDKAYEMLRNVELYGMLLKNVAIATIAGILMVLLLSLIIKLMKKRMAKISEINKTETSPESLLEKPLETESAADVQNNEEKQGEMICPNCGAHHDNPVKFCGICGTQMDYS